MTVLTKAGSTLHHIFGVEIFGGFLLALLELAAMLEQPGKLSVRARRLNTGQAHK